MNTNPLLWVSILNRKALELKKIHFKEKTWRPLTKAYWVRGQYEVWEWHTASNNQSNNTKSHYRK